MRQGGQRIAQVLSAASLAATLLLGGCGGGVDGVELNGKVFDWLGVSPAALAASKKEPKMAARAPLVLPPDTQRLPTPGSEQAPSDLAGVDDPDRRKVAEAKERERLHKAYCSGEMTWKENTFDPRLTNNHNRSPYGPCSGLLSGITGNIKQGE
jgi:hypothetical protein